MIRRPLPAPLEQWMPVNPVEWHTRSWMTRCQMAWAGGTTERWWSPWLKGLHRETDRSSAADKNRNQNRNKSGLEILEKLLFQRHSGWPLLRLWQLWKVRVKSAKTKAALTACEKTTVEAQIQKGETAQFPFPTKPQQVPQLENDLKIHKGMLEWHCKILFSDWWGGGWHWGAWDLFSKAGIY